MNTPSMTKKKEKRSIKAPIHRIILKTFKTRNTFSTQNLHIRKFCCTFAATNEKFADIIKKRLLWGPHNFKQWGVLSACFGTMKSCKISPAQNKRAVNARWDMYIPPQSVHVWTALFGGISYSAWALLAYSC